MEFLSFSQIPRADATTSDVTTLPVEPNTQRQGCDCLAGVECLVNVAKALGMGSCLSIESGGTLSGSSSTSANKSKTVKTYLDSSSDIKMEEILHKISGRFFRNESGPDFSLFTLQGSKGINQDSKIVWQNFGLKTNAVFCGIFDGHGPNGHLVARRVRDSLPLRLMSFIWDVNLKDEDVLREINQNETSSLNPEDIFSSSVFAGEESISSADIEDVEKKSEFFQTFKESFLNAFETMDMELKMCRNIDCICSGTTAVALVKQGRDVFIGNVGDSRAVIATIDTDNSLTAVQLTVDQKPNIPAEAARILKSKGRVIALRDEPGQARVWLPKSNAPGLAMSRSLGDHCLKVHGVISVPEIYYWRLTNKDKFIVLATDGVWDVLSNKQVINIAASASSPSSAARKVVTFAARAWKSMYPTIKADDISCVCFFLDGHENNVPVNAADLPGPSGVLD